MFSRQTGYCYWERQDQGVRDKDVSRRELTREWRGNDEAEAAWEQKG